MRKLRNYGTVLLVGTLFSACSTLQDGKQESATEQQATSSAEIVDSLKRQLKERDRRIAELTFQLEALKRIDQDQEQRRRPHRTPATLTPSDTDR